MPPYLVGDISRYIVIVLFSDYWVVNIDNMVLEVPIQWYTRIIVFHLSGSLDSIFKMIYDNRSK